jgi:ferredoxin
MKNISERKIGDFLVRIEKDNCIASKNCINVAPELFELDENRICEFVEKQNNISKDKIIESCSVCPVNVLYVFDKDGKQIIP